MATLKVLIVTNEAKKETKVIIQKKKFDDYQKFQELKDEIIGQCKKKVLKIFSQPSIILF